MTAAINQAPAISWAHLPGHKPSAKTVGTSPAQNGDAHAAARGSSPWVRALPNPPSLPEVSPGPSTADQLKGGDDETNGRPRAGPFKGKAKVKSTGIKDYPLTPALASCTKKLRELD